MAAGRPPDPSNPPPPPVSSFSMLQGTNQNTKDPKNSQPPVNNDGLQAIDFQKTPVSPRAQKKSFLSVAAGEKLQIIPTNREPFWYRDRPAVAFFEDEIVALAQPFKHSMVGKFSRMPKLNDIRAAFKGISLVGVYEIRWLDYKHILIHLSNEQDLNRLWMRQAWFIANQKMRVFKWTPDFQPEKESSLVPVWISFPNLRAHLYEKSALLMIAKSVGRPLFVDEATANGTRPSVARVCVEYDCQQPPLEQIWIVTRDRRTGDITGGFQQKVDFAKLPNYCTHCCHVGHSASTCLVMGHRMEKAENSNAQPYTGRKQAENERKEVANKPTGDPMSSKGTDRKNIEKRPTAADTVPGGDVAAAVEKKKKNPSREIPTKVFPRWQVVGSLDRPAVQVSIGAKTVLENVGKEQYSSLNRFTVLGSVEKEENEEQQQMEKQGQKDDENSAPERKNLLSGPPVEVEDRQNNGAVKTCGFQEGRRLASVNPKPQQQQFFSSKKVEDTADVVHITAVEEQTMVAVYKKDDRISVGAEFGADFPVKPQAVEGGKQEVFHVNRVHGQRENFFGKRETPPADKSYAIVPPVAPAAGKSDVRCSLKGERDMKLTTPAEVVPAFAVTVMHGDGQQKAESGSGAKNESGASNKNNFLGALQCTAERQDNATFGISEMQEDLKMGSNAFTANMQQQIMDDKGEKLFTVGKEAISSISATSRFSGHGRLDDVAGTGYVLDDSELLNGDQQNIQRGEENTQKITVRKHKLKKKAKPVLTGLVPVMVIENDEVFLKEAEPAASPQLVSCHSSLAEENVHVSKIAAEKYERQEGHDENDPNKGLNLTVCGFNKELSFVPSNAGTSSFTSHAAHAKKDDPGGDNLEISSMQPLADSDSVNLEVHPCIARRRKSESSLDHEYVRMRLGFETVISNVSHKIWIFCSEEIGCEILLDHVQYLHVKITVPWLSHPIFSSLVYAKCTRQERLELWNCLRSISWDMQGPWMVGGDFNSILSSAERLHGAHPHSGSMEDFATMLLDCGLLDAGYEGNNFTWTNNHMFQRLDRVVYNHEWADCFNNTRIQHLNRDGSDHCPLLISCNNTVQRGPSNFRFLHAWTHHHDFIPFVERSWRVPMQATGMLVFWQKQQRLKRDLKWWNKQIFGDIFHNLKLAEAEAAERELHFQQDPSILNRNLMHKAYAKLNRQLSIEESFWQQKSGVKWLVEGERNTKFFHMRMKKKRVRGHIFRIQDQEGNIIEEPSLIKYSAVDFFQNLLKAENCDLSRNMNRSLASRLIIKKVVLSPPMVVHCQEGKSYPIPQIRDRISGWENKILSPGGRITLLRSVLSSQPMYLLQVIKPPVTVIEKIERLFNSFLWGDSNDGKKLHWTAWSKITFPVSEGGLGIRNLRDVFEAFSLKLWWRFQTCNSLWTRFLKTKYCLGRIPHFVQPKLHDSQVWKRMIFGRDVALQNIRWGIGKGELFFWHDCWMGDLPLSNLFPSFHNDMSHVHKFYNGDGWDIVKLNSCLPMSLIDEILQIPFDRSQEDIAYWALTSNGDFSLWSAWEAELQALLRGLLLCKERNITNLWIEMDALVAVQMIQQSQKGSHDLRVAGPCENFQYKKKKKKTKKESMQNALNQHDFPSLSTTHGLLSGRPPEPPHLPPAAPAPPAAETTTLLTTNPPSIWTKNSRLPLSHGCQQTTPTQIQPPPSPRSQKKSFLSIVSGDKPPVIPLSRDPLVFKDRPAAAFFEDEIQTLAQPLKLSLVGKFSRMPKLQDVRSAFKGIGLTGAYEVRWLDYKHVLIHLSNEQDCNRVWTKQVWFIANQKMRVFKWTPEFEPEKESAVVPVWIAFPNLKAHLFEKSALLLIAKTVGKPLFVDEATANGSRPSVARVCIEFDCRRPPIDQVWIVVQNRETGTVTSGYPQRVEFSQMPAYCDHCCHVGHKENDCIVLGNKDKSLGLSKSQSLRTLAVEKKTGYGGGSEKNLEKRKNPEKEKIVRPEEPASLRWQQVSKAGISGTKDQQGKEIVPVLNRFQAISEDRDESQNRDVRQTEGTIQGIEVVADARVQAGKPQADMRKALVMEEQYNAKVNIEQQNGIEKVELSTTKQSSPSGGKVTGIPEVGEVLFRDRIEEQRAGKEGQNGSSRQGGTENEAVFSVNSQTSEDATHATIHENRKQKQNEKTEGDGEMEESTGADVQDCIVGPGKMTTDGLNKKKKESQKLFSRPQDKDKYVLNPGLGHEQLASVPTAGQQKPRPPTALHGRQVQTSHVSPDVQTLFHGNEIQGQPDNAADVEGSPTKLKKGNEQEPFDVHGLHGQKGGFTSEKTWTDPTRGETPVKVAVGRTATDPFPHVTEQRDPTNSEASKKGREQIESAGTDMTSGQQKMQEATGENSNKYFSNSPLHGSVRTGENLALKNSSPPPRLSEAPRKILLKQRNATKANGVENMAAQHETVDPVVATPRVGIDERPSDSYGGANTPNQATNISTNTINQKGNRSGRQKKGIAKTTLHGDESLTPTKPTGTREVEMTPPIEGEGTAAGGFTRSPPRHELEDHILGLKAQETTLAIQHDGTLLQKAEYAGTSQNLNNDILEPSTQTTARTQKKEHRIAQSGSRLQNLLSDILEGSGEHVPIEEEGTS
ncbi:Uncharacterized protein TCM_042329 [Theobroma cacao]|uniref:DUF4283 domain-containing protein n=1 Tax=Theobroma cacao TaxID=3641 RepID=A0A061H0G6_THECC|nr:Uncharacterized protein TCM_042329 [Theobroma cacao]